MAEEKNAVKLSRRERRLLEIKKTITNPNDIKYRGPFSYRYLRIFAWIFYALGQVFLIHSLSNRIINLDQLGDIGKTLLSSLGSLSLPFFIIASFGLVLSKKREYKKLLGTYALAYLGVGISICFLYFRYINGILDLFGRPDFILEEINNFLNNKVGINVFADLFAFVTFNFFINYRPTKHFQGKKIGFFRFFSILPILFVLASYIIKVLIGIGELEISIYYYPFLTTKSPLVFLMFIVISIWIKHRERIFARFGLTKEEYHKFLSTNRNSLSFATNLALTILLFAFLEVLVFLGLTFLYDSAISQSGEHFIRFLNIFGVGQCLSMLFAIPLIFLYSYTKTHKNNTIDIFISIGGIALVALVYLEAIYQGILQFFGH